MKSFENTSYSDGFGIFNKVNEEEFDVVNKNWLRLFMLNTENKLFNYDELYEYILPNITKYVFDRKRNLEASQDPKKASTLILDALSHLRPVTSEKDKGAGGELGEILLYLFLEQDLKAPKLFSKVELKTNHKDYIKGCDGIHFKFRTKPNGEKILQLVIGEAKIQDELKDGIEASFKSIDIYLKDNIQERNLLDTHLMNQIVDEQEAKIIKDYILAVPRKKKETVFGIFIGYSIDYSGEKDTNDQYDEKVIQENIKQVLEYKSLIVDTIKEYNISNYEFNFYFLPFNNAQRDRKIIIESLTSGSPHLKWKEIRNG